MNHPAIPEALTKAQEWIIKQGGIEAAQTMTKFKLAIYGQYSWDELWSVPLFLFKKEGLYQHTYIKDLTA